MNKVQIFIVLAATLMVSCKKFTDDSVKPKTHQTSTFEGAYVSPIWYDSVVTYQRMSSVKDDEYGITFKPNGVVIEHANSGFCGTPPVAYSEYVGTWSQQDSIVKATIPYWGGTTDLTWKIVALTSRALTIKEVSRVYHN